jgi:hypothetical protein
MSQNDEHPPYKVGYKRPPREHQIKKGEQRSPGRPKGSKSFSTYLQEEMRVLVPVRINGRLYKRTRMQLAAAQVAIEATKTNFKAIDVVKANEKAAQPAIHDDVSDPFDELSIADVVARMRIGLLAEHEGSSTGEAQADEGGAAVTPPKSDKA